MRTFLAVARAGTVSGGARTLGVAQPTVSVQLRAFERAVGQTLFTRGPRRVTITEAGRVAERYVEELLGVEAALHRTLRGGGADTGRRFVVGVADSLPKLSAARLLAPAREGRPKPHLVVRVDRTEMLLGELATHAIDLVLSDLPAPPTTTIQAFTHLLGDCGVTVFAPRPLAARLRARFPRSLAEAPWVIPTPHTALRASLDRWLITAGIRARAVAEVEDPAVAQALAPELGAVFAAPALVEAAIVRQYRVAALGRLPGVRERFYAITTERRLVHPAVRRIASSARRALR
jgi:LysR family transcriptional activator of nhaA